MNMEINCRSQDYIKGTRVLPSEDGRLKSQIVAVVVDTVSEVLDMAMDCTIDGGGINCLKRRRWRIKV